MPSSCFSDEQLKYLAAIAGPLVSAIGVLFWQLLAEMRKRAERAEDQVDTLTPAITKLTGAVEAQNSLMETRRGR